MSYLGGFTLSGDSGFEIPDCSFDVLDNGAGEQMDLDVLINLSPEPHEFVLWPHSVEQVMDAAQMSAKLLLSFDEIDIKSLVGQAQGGGHARQASADHERGLFHLDHLPVEWLQQPRLGDRNPRQVLGFLGGFFRLVHVYP